MSTGLWPWAWCDIVFALSCEMCHHKGTCACWWEFQLASIDPGVSAPTSNSLVISSHTLLSQSKLLLFQRHSMFQASFKQFLRVFVLLTVWSMSRSKAPSLPLEQGMRMSWVPSIRAPVLLLSSVVAGLLARGFGAVGCSSWVISDTRQYESSGLWSIQLSLVNCCAVHSEAYSSTVSVFLSLSLHCCIG